MLRMFAVGWVLFGGLCTSVVAAEGTPSWTDIKHAVDRYFAAKANYHPGDLLTRGDVQPLLNELKQHGFRPEDISAGMDPFVPDNHGLAQLLKSTHGQPIMRKIATLPHGYDRLDRLSWFPEGQQLLKRAFGERESLKAIEALLSDASAADIEKRFQHEPLAANFAVDTGRIYTQAKLVEYLRMLHTLDRNNLSLPSQ